jgi:hypothetical protein
MTNTGRSVAVRLVIFNKCATEDNLDALKSPSFMRAGLPVPFSNHAASLPGMASSGGDSSESSPPSPFDRAVNSFSAQSGGGLAGPPPPSSGAR